MTRRTNVLLLVAAATALVSTGACGAYAQAPPGADQATPYPLEDIQHSFAVMEEYAVYGQYKSLSFDTAGAMQDVAVSRLDIDIALGFAAHSNSIVNAAAGPVARANELGARTPELKRAVQDLEEGRFRALFDSGAPAVRTVNDAAAALHEPDAAPAFAPHAPDAVQATSHQARSSNAVCGGSFQSPNPEPPVITKRWFARERTAEQYLINNGYHQVPQYASGNYGNDFAKVTSAYGCSNGEMRSQAVVFQSGNSWRHSTQSPEPNPEILSYAWPVYWWGAYVAWWHVTF